MLWTIFVILLVMWALGQVRARSNDSFQPRRIIRPRLLAELAVRQIESKAR
jgi:hypothetical protein